MKATVTPIFLALLCALPSLFGCARRGFTGWESVQSPIVSAQIRSFVAEKEAQAGAAARANGGEMPAEFKRFFAAASQGDWLAVSNDFQNFRKHAPQYEHTGKTDLQLRGTAWQAVIEVWGAFDSLGRGSEKYSALYAHEIIGSIPPGSIYFGGTDPGRFLITGMEKSQVNADPFFLLTQNALADSTYLDYVRSMYGKRLYIPTAKDSEKCFLDYSTDAETRARNHQLKPGENVTVDADGRVQVSGQAAVMEINGRLAKLIFDQNSNREFYIEESLPLDWMYPYLEPHGLILKLDRQPLARLSDQAIKADHDYWANLIQPMIGDWLDDDTPAQDVADVAEKVHGRRDFTTFSGDKQFIQSDYACRMFSEERANIADLYAWRAKQAADPGERERMSRSADFAFRQAWALCPYSADATFRYANFLAGGKKYSDALVLAETAIRLPEMDGRARGQMRALITQLQRLKRLHP